jgi:hypothetical protein
VVAVPEGHRVEELELAVAEAHAGDAEPMRFWTEFVSELRLDDPEQPQPKPTLQGYITLTLPAPGGSVWLNVYRNMRLNEVGVTLSFTRNTAGEYTVRNHRRLERGQASAWRWRSDNRRGRKAEDQGLPARRPTGSAGGPQEGFRLAGRACEHLRQRTPAPRAIGLS